MQTSLSTESALKFLNEQLLNWPEVAKRFASLNSVETRKLNVAERCFTLQHNPARITSTGAAVSSNAIEARPCFLCKNNRPEQQFALPINDKYELLVNPYPIFPVHFTIPSTTHTPQQLVYNSGNRFADMLTIAHQLPGLALFYNGAHCGASAPDHFHFQAVEASNLPLLQWASDGCALPFAVEYHKFIDISDAIKWGAEIMAKLPNPNKDPEPPINVICVRQNDGSINVCIIPRRAHRPEFYGSKDGQILVSPASVDLCGTIILPRPEDFYENFTSNHLTLLLTQTCYLNNSY